MKTFKNQRSVSAAEAKGIGEYDIDLRFARLIRHIVQVAVRIGRRVVHGWRDDLIAQRQDTDASFEASRAAEQMSGHALRRTHRQLRSIAAEAALDGHRFELVVVR